MIDSSKPKFHAFMALIGAMFFVSSIIMARNPKATDSVYFLTGGSGLLCIIGIINFIRLGIKNPIFRSAIISAVGFIALIVSLIFYNHPEFVGISFYIVFASGIIVAIGIIRIIVIMVLNKKANKK
jgi:hypothetical protein